MKKKKTAIFISICLILILALSISVSATTNKDTSGNVIITDDEGTETNRINSDKDFLWAGSELNLINSTVGYDAIIAGEKVNIKSSNIGNGVKIAGQDVLISGTRINNNVYAAGETVIISGGSLDTGFMAGYIVKYTGATANCLHIAADTVVLDGTVNGDVYISANNIEIGEHTVITGVLNCEGANPDIATGASVGAVNADASEVSASMDSSVLIYALLIILAISVLSFFIYWLILRIFFKRALERSTKIMRSVPLSFFITGVLIILCSPVFIVILCLTIIGIPIALLYLGFYILLAIVAVPFTACAMGQMIFKKRNPWLGSLLGILITIVIMCLPPIRELMELFSCVFFFGFIGKTIYYRQIRKKKENTVPADNFSFNHDGYELSEASSDSETINDSENSKNKEELNNTIEI